MRRWWRTCSSSATTALDAVATCYADANAELDKLRASVAELEKAAAPAK
jgi:hypothetical protein